MDKDEILEKDVSSYGAMEELGLASNIQASPQDLTFIQEVRRRRVAFALVGAILLGLIALALLSGYFAIVKANSATDNTIKGYIIGLLELAAALFIAGLAGGALGYGSSYLCISNDPNKPGCCGEEDNANEIFDEQGRFKRSIPQNRHR